MPDWMIRTQFTREQMIEVTAETLQRIYGDDDEDAAWAYFFGHCNDLGRADEVGGDTYVEELYDMDEQTGT